MFVQCRSRNTHVNDGGLTGFLLVTVFLAVRHVVRLGDSLVATSWSQRLGAASSLLPKSLELLIDPMLCSTCKFLHPPMAAPVRRAALGGDVISATAKGSDDGNAAGTATGEGGSSSSCEDGGGASTSDTKTNTTPLGKRAEEGQGAEAADGGPEAPSPTKARKGST